MFFILYFALLWSLLPQMLPAQEEENEEEKNWNASVALKYLSRYTSYGVDLSEDQPAVLCEGDLFHASGLNAGAAIVTAVGSRSGYQQSLFRLGYMYNIGTRWTLSASYTYHSYSSDTVNVLAKIPNSLLLKATAHLGPVNASGSYNLFLGDGSANYFALTLSTTRTFGKLSVEPEVEASFASQTVDVSILPRNRGQAKKQPGGTTTTTVTGLSELTVLATLSYPVTEGLSLLFIPGYLYSPLDLSARSSQFLWYAGAMYSFEF